MKFFCIALGLLGLPREQKFFCKRAVNIYYDAIPQNSNGSLIIFQYDLSLNAKYRSAMKSPVIGSFVHTFFSLQSVFRYFKGTCYEER